MPKPMVVAIGHQKGVGKSTFAKYLVTSLRISKPGVKICTASIAGKIKSAAFDLFGYLGLKDEAFYEKHYNEKEVPLPCGWTPRDIWIKVGNELRSIDDNVWIQNALQSDCDYLIIPDLRFVNEILPIKSVGGILIKIDRDVPRGTDAAETSLLGYDGWDIVVDNNNKLSDLYQEAEKWTKS